MDVKLPNLGEGADSGTVVSVLVKPGATVRKGQNIIEVETGKAVAPIPSPADGKVGKIAVKEGDQVTAGQVVLVLEPTGDGQPAEAPAKSEPAEEAPAPARGAAPRPARPAAPRVEPAATTAEEGFEEEIINEEPAAGPYVRQVARDVGIDLRFVRGSGKSGQILISDLRDYVARLRSAALSRSAAAPGAPAEAAPAPAIDFARWGPISRKPMTQLRKVIAQRMVESTRTLPMVTQFDEADLSVIQELRKRHAAAYEAQGVRLTVTSFVLWCVAAVLKKHPIFNSSLDEAAGEIVFKEYIHLGIAVDTEAGLLVPVLRDADKKDMLELSRGIQEIAEKARDRKVALADMQGASFTISNQGGIGGGHFTPIINPPETAILGLGRAASKAVVRDGQIVIRQMLPLALTYDHRLVDGADAARFMVDLVGALEGFREQDVRR